MIVFEGKLHRNASTDGLVHKGIERKRRSTDERTITVVHQLVEHLVAFGSEKFTNGGIVLLLDSLNDLVDRLQIYALVILFRYLGRIRDGSFLLDDLCQLLTSLLDVALAAHLQVAVSLWQRETVEDVHYHLQFRILAGLLLIGILILQLNVRDTRVGT